jgi:hypothetical protein
VWRVITRRGNQLGFHVRDLRGAFGRERFRDDTRVRTRDLPQPKRFGNHRKLLEFAGQLHMPARDTTIQMASDP